jgi:hypothetical protein
MKEHEHTDLIDLGIRDDLTNCPLHGDLTLTVNIHCSPVLNRQLSDILLGPHDSLFIT